jgi:hypothetical protein
LFFFLAAFLFKGQVEIGTASGRLVVEMGAHPLAVDTTHKKNAEGIAGRYSFMFPGR